MRSAQRTEAHPWGAPPSPALEATSGPSAESPSAFEKTPRTPVPGPRFGGYGTKTLVAKRLENRDSMFIRGFRSRELIGECGGHPQWSRTHGAWMTNVRVGSDVIAAAEADGYEVVFAVVDAKSRPITRPAPAESGGAA